MVTLVAPSAGYGVLVRPMADFVVMTPAASLFAADPAIVQAAIGESASK
jgi:methylmalonyl-CoA decarboxylase subunit alpha